MPVSFSLLLLVPKLHAWATWASQVALVVKNLPANAGDPGSLPGWGRSPGGGYGKPLQYACLENPMDRGAWWGHIQSFRVRKGQTAEATEHTDMPAPCLAQD